MSTLVTFNFVSQHVRIVMCGDEPWFVAADVCDALTISNSRMALDRLDDDEKGVSSIDTPGGKQELSIINESGLYSLILTSRKPEAKKFKKWVTSEVLPTLRKAGRYEMSGATLTPSQIKDLYKAATNLAQPFYLENSTRLWLLKYAREYAGVRCFNQIPAVRCNDVIDYLESIRIPTKAYIRERIRHERAFLTQTLQRELDRRLGYSGPIFEMIAINKTDL